jgi:hypothetical protein
LGEGATERAREGDGAKGFTANEVTERDGVRERDGFEDVKESSTERGGERAREERDGGGVEARARRSVVQESAKGKDVGVRRRVVHSARPKKRRVFGFDT